MALDERFINTIERSLLTDLVGLYTCDLKTERHLPGHLLCLACSKEAIVRAILAYQFLDDCLRANGARESLEPLESSKSSKPP